MAFDVTSLKRMVWQVTDVLPQSMPHYEKAIGRNAAVCFLLGDMELARNAYKEISKR
jgi:hypothetical protein